jgi:hypothetical protein
MVCIKKFKNTKFIGINVKIKAFWYLIPCRLINVFGTWNVQGSSSVLQDSSPTHPLFWKTNNSKARLLRRRSKRSDRLDGFADVDDVVVVMIVMMM